uniref:Uncharacterized protein n=1 Tax=Rhodnius prolixus TaxID=13249 RepID=T1IAM0_RHOPR
MKVCILVLLAAVLAEVHCAQVKSNRRESKYPTREPMGIFPDLTKRHSRTFRSARHSMANNYKWDNGLLADDNVIPRQDNLFIGKPGQLLMEKAKKSINLEQKKLEAIMNNEIDDDYDEVM